MRWCVCSPEAWWGSAMVSARRSKRRLSSRVMNRRARAGLRADTRQEHPSWQPGRLDTGHGEVETARAEDTCFGSGR